LSYCYYSGLSRCSRYRGRHLAGLAPQRLRLTRLSHRTTTWQSGQVRSKSSSD